VSEASNADINITQKLQSALELVDIRVLDHFVCGTDIISMREKGLF
jgi:DNA repair protein RadC